MYFFFNQSKNWHHSQKNTPSETSRSTFNLLLSRGKFNKYPKRVKHNHSCGEYKNIEIYCVYIYIYIYSKNIVKNCTKQAIWLNAVAIVLQWIHTCSHFLLSVHLITNTVYRSVCISKPSGIKSEDQSTF